MYRSYQRTHTFNIHVTTLMGVGGEQWHLRKQKPLVLVPTFQVWCWGELGARGEKGSTSQKGAFLAYGPLQKPIKLSPPRLFSGMLANWIEGDAAYRAPLQAVRAACPF